MKRSQLFNLLALLLIGCLAFPVTATAVEFSESGEVVFPFRMAGPILFDETKSPSALLNAESDEGPTEEPGEGKEVGK